MLERGLLTPEQAELAEQAAGDTGRPVLKVLVEDGHASETAIYEVVADEARMPFMDLTDFQPDPTAIGMLSGEWALRLHALPFGWDGSTLLVAVSDPNSLTLRDDLARLTQVPTQLYLGALSQVAAAIAQEYRSDDQLDDLSQGIELDNTDEDDDTVTLTGGDQDAPIIKFVNLLVSQAIADRASDIHVEPTEKELAVRYRIDGVLHSQRPTSKALTNGVVSRIKIMANMDIAEHRIPQDGRMSVTAHGRKVDLRVSTLPTVHGEKVVMRILDAAATPLELREIGFTERHIDIFERQYRKPHGMILVTGPTGSGKSTTLYSTLNAIRNETINIITVEDPVEYRMAGVTQMQVNPQAKLTFSSALRAILRADPDIILVGEIRDQETAQVAVEAALTGHLVLSTLHTNDAPSATTRLIEMGVEPFLVGSAVSTIIAQRLLRRLCDRCKTEYQLELNELTAAGIPWNPEDPLPMVYRADPAGCRNCSHTGFRGRTSIHEVLVIDDAIERAVNEAAHADTLRQLAVNSGMEPIRLDGFYKVLAGITSLEEVLRVVG